MKTKTLLWKRAVSFAICLMFFSQFGLAQDRSWTFFTYCPTGQKVFCHVTSYTAHTAEFVCPSDIQIWSGTPKPTGNITLPSVVTNPNTGISYTITGIGLKAFATCTGLTGDLIIPETVTYIKESAFQFCSGFDGNLVIPNSVTQIDKQAFFGTGFTGDLIIPNSVTTIGRQAFFGCDSFNGSLVLGNSLTSLGQEVFEGCSGFTGQLVLPNTLTSIPTRAFYGCSNLSGDLVIPNSITIIRESSFEGCSGLNGMVVIPNSVTKIQDYAFKGCNHITKYIVLCETPPVIYGNNSQTTPTTFSGLGTNTLFYVPSSSLSAYQSANYWSSFSSRLRGSSIFKGNASNANWSTSANWVGGTVPSSVDFVVVNSNCNMNIPSLTANNITILPGNTFTIKPNCALTVGISLTNLGTAGNLIIQNGGQLRNAQATNVMATIEKTVDGFTQGQDDGWTLFSFPSSTDCSIASVSSLLSNEYDLYYYSEPNAFWINQKSSTNNFDEIEAHKGYLYANSGNITLRYEGELVCGETPVSIPLSYTNNVMFKGFNLIGNPYTHQVTSYNSHNVYNDCFRMNSCNNGLIISEISEENPLKPTEGFFVEAYATGASITLNQERRDEIDPVGNIKIDVLKDNNTLDRLIIKDVSGEPLQKMTLNSQVTTLYTTKDDINYAAIERGELEQTINFKTERNGTYTIHTSIEGMDLDYLHLVDNFTGGDVDLLVADSYTFEAKKGDFPSRFRLVFSPTAFFNSDDEVFAFINFGSLILQNEGEATLQIIDMTGRVLSEESVDGNESIPVNLSSGVYVIRLINGDKIKTQKIVVDR